MRSSNKPVGSIGVDGSEGSAMSFVRLSSVAPELVDDLLRLDPVQSERIALAVVDWILEEVRVEDPRLTAALSVLRGGRVDSETRSRLQELVEELDERAWDIQDALAGSQFQDESDYTEAFARARAVNAVWYALGGPSAEMTVECAYEAQAAEGDLEGLRNVVSHVLGGE
jgi:hypothetical protein